MDWRFRSMRRPAVNAPGEAHELTFLKRERVCGWLADALNDARAKLDVRLWAYVFMPDHVHLLIWYIHANPVRGDWEIGPKNGGGRAPAGTKGKARCAPSQLILAD